MKGGSLLYLKIIKREINLFYLKIRPGKTESSINTADINYLSPLQYLKNKYIKEERGLSTYSRYLKFMVLFYLALFISSIFQSFVNLEKLFWIAGVSGT